jgi:hypothetical protein
MRFEDFRVTRAKEYDDAKLIPGTPRRQQRGGVGCRSVLLSVFASNQGGHDIQGGGGRHPALFPALDCAPRNSAEIGKRLSGQPALVADSLDAWRVVQDLADVVKDDRLAVTAGWMIGGYSHGLLLVKVDHLRVASAVEELLKSVIVFEHAGKNLIDDLPHVFDLDLFDLGHQAKGFRSAEAMASFKRDPDPVAVVVKGFDCRRPKFAHLGGNLCQVGFVVFGMKQNDGGHCLGGWSLASLPLTRTTYAIVRKSQQLFTQSCVFFLRAVFRPLNKELNFCDVSRRKRRK